MSENRAMGIDAQTRVETDSLGDVHVPAAALWGAQTQRAIDNFPVSGQPMPPAFISAVARVKQAAAEANASLGLLDNSRGDAITDACRALIRGEFSDQFPRSRTCVGLFTNVKRSSPLR